MGVIERDLGRKSFPASLEEEILRTPGTAVTTEMILRVFLYGIPVIDYFPKSEEGHAELAPTIDKEAIREIVDRIKRRDFNGLSEFICDKRDLEHGVTVAEFFVDRVRVNEVVVADIYRNGKKEIYVRQLPTHTSLGILNEIERAKREGWIVYNTTRAATSF